MDECSCQGQDSGLNGMANGGLRLNGTASRFVLCLKEKSSVALGVFSNPKGFSPRTPDLTSPKTDEKIPHTVVPVAVPLHNGSGGRECLNAPAT